MKVPEMIRTCLISWTILTIISILLISRNPYFLKEELIRIEKEKEKSLINIADIHSYDI